MVQISSGEQKKTPILYLCGLLGADLADNTGFDPGQPAECSVNALLSGSLLFKADWGM